MSGTSRLLIRSAEVLLLLQTTICVSVVAGKEDRVSGGVRDYEDNDYDYDSVYDHQAFESESRVFGFHQLSRDEGKRRLSLLMEKMDRNADRVISPEELRQWIADQQESSIRQDVERQWKGLIDDQRDNQSSIGWEEYRHLTYGFMQDGTQDDQSHDVHTYKELLRRDRRRFSLADQDRDNRLTLSEFRYFLHPEEGTAEHMHSVLMEETIEDLDTDMDGKISIEEYMSQHMYSGRESQSVPEWVTRERQGFEETRDKDGDGLMDRQEVRHWILTPYDYDASDAESQHLIRQSDGDGDGVLSREEILRNYDLFVGSQATDFGEALLTHDDL
jgi:Ca2+-binding EF-hand superfamily protein